MKRFFFLAAIAAAFLLSATPKAQAADVSIDFFYDNLGDDGSWFEVGDYGYVWQPSVAASNPEWRPYTDGYWAYTDVGWTWVSYEDFGWATYHYGRWSRLANEGWVWVPGYEWGPAWVSWRTGGDQVGWAPLPPRYRSGGGGELVYEGQPISGRVDIDFDIGPSYYNFVDVRYIGAPVLREHIYAPSQNITYISRTVNVTNITRNKSVVYNYGPDYDRLNRYSTRPIQRLLLRREREFDPGVRRRGRDFTKVEGSNLVIAAPQTLQRRSERLAPRNVRRRIERPDFQTGWAGITDAKAKADLQERFRKEDPKVIPPPQATPQNAPAAVANATPPTTQSPGVTATPPTPVVSPAAVQPSPGGTATPTATAAVAASPAATATEERGRGRSRRSQESQPTSASPAASPAAAASPAVTKPAAQGRGRNQRQRQRERGVQPASPVSSPPAIPAPAATAQPATASTPAAVVPRGTAAEPTPAVVIPAAPPTTGGSGDAPIRRGNPRDPAKSDRSESPGNLQPPGDAANDTPVIAPQREGNGRGKQKPYRPEQTPQAPEPAAVAPAPQAPATPAAPSDQPRPRGRDTQAAPNQTGSQPAAAPIPSGQGKQRGSNKKDKKEPAASPAPGQ